LPAVDVAPVEAVVPLVVGGPVVPLVLGGSVVPSVVGGSVVPLVVGGSVVPLVVGGSVVLVVEEVVVPEVGGGRVVVVAGSHTVVGGLELMVGSTSVEVGGLPGDVVVGRRVVVGWAGRTGWESWWWAGLGRTGRRGREVTHSFARRRWPARSRSLHALAARMHVAIGPGSRACCQRFFQALGQRASLVWWRRFQGRSPWWSFSRCHRFHALAVKRDWS
jgi:hypothetical protein